MKPTCWKTKKGLLSMRVVKERGSEVHMGITGGVCAQQGVPCFTLRIHTPSFPCPTHQHE